MTNSTAPSTSTIARAYTRGPRATISRTIIAGQPQSLSTVRVISTNGDTLTYTSDGVWFSTATRSDITEWELIDLAMPARVTFRAPGVAPITLSHDDMRDLGASDTVVFFGITYTRTN